MESRGKALEIPSICHLLDPLEGKKQPNLQIKMDEELHTSDQGFGILVVPVRGYRQAKDVITAIRKRMGNKKSNVELWAISLLEMLMNNCGQPIHREVIESGLLPILVKIVKKRSDLPVREKIFLLLDATQTSLGGTSGEFPQYYAAYLELVNAGVEFSQAPQVVPNTSSKEQKENTSGAKPLSPKSVVVAQQPSSQNFPESSIIEKAGATLGVLREVLNVIDIQHPEGAKDEFTLDLVEQCSFQKQRVMHLVLTSRDENVVSRAIKLNEQLQSILARHDALLAVGNTSTSTHFTHDEMEEEEEDTLFRRIRKGKACMRAEDQNHLQKNANLEILTQEERLHRPLIRPLCLEPKESSTPVPPVIPPPPANHVERERFFQKQVDGSALEGDMSNLTLRSRNSSSSHGKSVDSSD